MNKVPRPAGSFFGKENGIEDLAIVAGNEFSVQNGYLETKLLLNREKRPTAIFALSNNRIKDIVFGYDKVLNFDEKGSPSTEKRG